MKIKLRNAEEKDVSSIRGIINYEIVHSTATYDYYEKSPEKQLEWFRKKQKDNMPVIVAEKNGQVIGYGTFDIFRARDGYKYSVEHSIYIEKDSRNLGVGQLLLQELIHVAKTNGYHTMVAGIDASNKGSYSFHQKFGFVEVGRFREIGYKFDRWLDLVFMQLFLTEEPVN